MSCSIRVLSQIILRLNENSQTNTFTSKNYTIKYGLIEENLKKKKYEKLNMYKYI